MPPSAAPTWTGCSCAALLVLAPCATAGCGGRTPLDGTIGSGAPSSSPSPAAAADAAAAGQDANAFPAVTCTPGILAGGLTIADDLVLDSTAAYWIEEGPGGGGSPQQIQRCDKTGCPGAPVAVVPDVVNANALVRDGARLFWAQVTASTVNVCDVSACAPTTFATLADPPVAIAIDATDVYIASYHSLSRCAKSGCSAPTILTATGSPPIAIMVDATDVYYLDATPPGSLRACAKPDCAGGPRTVVGVTDAYDLRVDEQNAYFCVGGGAADPDTAGAVLSCPKAGCATPTTLAAGLHHPGTIAIDATRVYWADQGTVANLYRDGDVGSCPKSGCTGAPVVHASGQSLPTSVAVDDACVYWASDSPVGSPPPPGGASGSIQAAAKR